MKKPDVKLVTALYERAVKLHFGDPGLWTDFLRFTVRAGLALFGGRKLLNFVVRRAQNTHSTSAEAPVDVARRAVRNVPWSGDTWAAAILVFVSLWPRLSRPSAEGEGCRNDVCSRWKRSRVFARRQSPPACWTIASSTSSPSSPAERAITVVDSRHTVSPAQARHVGC